MLRPSERNKDREIHRGVVEKRETRKDQRQFLTEASRRARETRRDHGRFITEASRRARETTRDYGGIEDRRGEIDFLERRRRLMAESSRERHKKRLFREKERERYAES